MIKAGRWARGIWVAAALSLLAGASAGAAGFQDTGKDVTVTTTPVPDQQGLIPRRLVWPGVVVIVVIAVIVTAALTGPIIRANNDDEEEEKSSPSE